METPERLMTGAVPSGLELLSLEQLEACSSSLAAGSSQHCRIEPCPSCCVEQWSRERLRPAPLGLPPRAQLHWIIRAGRGSLRHAERCTPEERSGGGVPQWRMAKGSPEAEPMHAGTSAGSRVRQ